MASSGSTPLASWATRSTRRAGSTEKFWMVSAKILPLPTMVLTLSGVMMTVPNSPEFMHRADHAADADEVAHLERAQHQHEGAGGEVAEQPAPGGADRQAGAGQQGGEGGGLDAHVAHDAEHQGDVQRDGDDRAEVLGQRRVDVVAVHRRLHQPDHPADQPAADDPEGECGDYLDRQFGGGGAEEGLYGLHVHGGDSFRKIVWSMHAMPVPGCRRQTRARRRRWQAWHELGRAAVRQAAFAVTSGRRSKAAISSFCRACAWMIERSLTGP
jgi:hypothetical protein